MIRDGAWALWRELASFALEPVFVAFACGFVLYETGIRPFVARWSQAVSAAGMALTAYPPASEAAWPSISRSVKAAATRWSGAFS